MQYKTIIISDIHLGTKDSKYIQVLDFLKNNKCDNLILNGDIIDGIYIKFFGGWKQGYMDVINYIINLANSKQSKVYYIAGNHDGFLRKLLPINYGDIQFKDDMTYQSGGKKYYICHGDQFDKTLGKLYILTFILFIGSQFLYLLNRLYNNRRANRGLKYFSLMEHIKLIANKIITGGKKQFANQLIETAKVNKCQGIICGHFHQAENKMIGKIHYLNSGDWVESYAQTAIAEDYNGNREILYYHK